MQKDYSSMTLAELKETAKEMGLEKTSKLNKQELALLVSETAQQRDKRYAKLKDSIDETVEMSGIVQVLPEGYGLLKTPEMKSKDEYVYVSASQVQKFKLLTGYEISGKVRPPKENETYYAMLFLENVNGKSTQQILEEEKKKMSADNSKDMTQYEISHSGILELTADGYGFLRKNNYMAGDDDIYVSPSQIRKYRLKNGDCVQGRIRTSGENEKYDALLYVEKVNGMDPECIVNRAEFEKLIPVFPNEKIKLETDSKIISTRILDMFAPIGKGQRGLIVAAPKAGKTILLKNIAKAIEKNHPNIKLIILLVDERPEEVTDMQRSVNADVVYSTFDQKPSNHIKAAEIVLDRAKRLVESKKDVVILVDSITRLARANNLVVAPSGRTLSGGLDPESLYFPKKFFGAARNIEGGGSLTILATALVDTGSRMDDMIYEEFKGTGNMEVHLERELAESRIFPAINIQRSGTRREELLLTKEELSASYAVRKSFANIGTAGFSESVIQTMNKTRSNEDFVCLISKNCSNCNK